MEVARSPLNPPLRRVINSNDNPNRLRSCSKKIGGIVKLNNRSGADPGIRNKGPGRYFHRWMV